MIRYAVRDAFNAPGLISLARLPLAFAFRRTKGHPGWAITLLVAAAASDIIDGWYARRFHEESPTGAALDAVMDKVFVLSVISTLVSNGSLTVGDALLLGARDLGEIPLVLRVFSGRGAHSTLRGSNIAGKLTTVLQFATLVAVLRRSSHKNLWVRVTSICGAVAAGTYWVRERAPGHRSVRPDDLASSLAATKIALSS